MAELRFICIAPPGRQLSAHPVMEETWNFAQTEFISLLWIFVVAFTSRLREGTTVNVLYFTYSLLIALRKKLEIDSSGRGMAKCCSASEQ